MTRGRNLATGGYMVDSTADDDMEQMVFPSAPNFHQCDASKGAASGGTCHKKGNVTRHKNRPDEPALRVGKLPWRIFGCSMR
eukprot:3654460-Amphidinium_carterae.1